MKPITRLNSFIPIPKRRVRLVGRRDGRRAGAFGKQRLVRGQRQDGQVLLAETCRLLLLLPWPVLEFQLHLGVGLAQLVHEIALRVELLKA